MADRTPEFAPDRRVRSAGAGCSAPGTGGTSASGKTSKTKKAEPPRVFDSSPPAPVPMPEAFKESDGDFNDSSPTLVRIQQGNVPVLILAPHGGSCQPNDDLGRWQLAKFKERSASGTSKARFHTKADSRTAFLARDISNHIEEATGGRRPYLISARFHRKYIDANRALEEDACPNDESAHAIAQRSIHSYYHASVHLAMENMRKSFHGRLKVIIDVHGQAAKDWTAPDDSIITAEDSQSMIYIGTCSGRSISSTSPLWGQSGLLKLLSTNMRVWPPNGNTSERPNLSGGYTVRKHGHCNTGVDAVQLEFGVQLRGCLPDEDKSTSDLRRERTASLVVEALGEAGYLAA